MDTTIENNCLCFGGPLHGYPFLLAFVREGFGIRLRFNCYIASRLEGELRDTDRVEVIECAASAHRRFTVPLQHAFD
ncbi:hypothetical protein [Burkholderia cenocepacia]|uniref:hypothetical protein n=1 Tax=Burkholderia cenocepacia TaxID=95486 RepID=UPI00285816C2|nr:hypothetical protein [Burkholderia cenocepacia]MDR8032098.1 hypothetical protein [Burkholderia cenocepacia]